MRTHPGVVTGDSEKHGRRMVGQTSTSESPRARGHGDGDAVSTKHQHGRNLTSTVFFFRSHHAASH